MTDWVLAVKWLVYMRERYKLWRFAIGGLWVNFDNDSWVRCRWCYGHTGEYLEHPQDGGMFSVKLRNIVAIENYSHRLGR